MEGLVLHENHVAHFKASDEVLNRGTEVAATGPDILNERDFVGLNFEFLSEPPVVKLDALVLEEHVLLWVIEHLDAQHDESTVMSACQANIIEVIESDAELRTDERVGRRLKLTSDAIGLEAVNTCCDVVNIVSPPCHDWVAFDGGARDAS